MTLRIYGADINVHAKCPCFYAIIKKIIETFSLSIVFKQRVTDSYDVHEKKFFATKGPLDGII